jgi:hypothetical protein
VAGRSSHKAPNPGHPRAGRIHLLVLFPDGHLPSRRWRVVAWLYGGALAVGLATAAVQPGTTVVLIGDLCRSARSGWGCGCAARGGRPGSS